MAELRQMREMVRRKVAKREGGKPDQHRKFGKSEGTGRDPSDQLKRLLWLLGLFGEIDWWLGLNFEP